VQLSANLPPSKMAQAITLLTCIRVVIGSNIGRDTDYPYLDFTLDVDGNAGMIP
jgi:hypothetical protein